MEKYIEIIVGLLLTKAVAVAWALIKLYFNDISKTEKIKELQENQKLLISKLDDMNTALTTIKENRHSDVLKFTNQLTQLEGEIKAANTIMKSVSKEIEGAKNLINSWVVKTK